MQTLNATYFTSMIHFTTNKLDAWDGKIRWEEQEERKDFPLFTWQSGANQIVPITAFLHLSNIIIMQKTKINDALLSKESHRRSRRAGGLAFCSKWDNPFSYLPMIILTIHLAAIAAHDEPITIVLGFNVV